MDIDVNIFLDKNGNPSRKRKESLMTKDQKDFLLSIHADINASLYCISNKILPPLCSVCSGICAFRNFKQGFGVVCSKGCASKLGSSSMKNKFDTITQEEKQRIEEKRKVSVREKYGVDHILQNQSVVESLKKKRRDKDHAQARSTIEKYFPHGEEIESHEYWKNLCEESSSVKDLAKKQGIQFSYIYRWWEKIGFESPFTRSSSGPEREICSFVESLGFNVEKNNRTVLGGKEIDIYIPEKKIGIELDGLYWHKGSTSRPKQIVAAKNGISLFCVFEDEWEEKQSIIESVLRNKLGKTEHKIFARKCVMNNVDPKEARNFLEENHLQGACAAKTHIGLFFNKELVCLASIGKSRFEKNKTELIRFCTKKNTLVVGGMTKLLKGNKNLVSYADRRFSPISSSYEAIGNLVGETGNGYYWVYKNKRISRFNTQKKKLGSLLKNYDPDLSESKNMEANGAYKIFDCGNWKYEIS